MENPRYVRDKQRLCNIFPEIRLSATYHETLVKVYHSSVFFQRLLHFQRCLLLFPTLLKFVRIYPRQNSLQLCLSSHPVVNNGKFTLLKLRLVRKSWCIALEDLSRFIAKAFVCTAITKITVSNQTDEETWFMNHFKNTHPPRQQRGRSPFVGDIVGLSWTKTTENFHEKNGHVPFQVMLDACGHHIRYCNLQLSQTGAPERWYQAAILQILRRMPNLVMLKFWLLEPGNGDSTSLQNSFNDLPTLVHFKVLLVDSKLSDKFVSTLLPKLPNVTKICTNLHNNFRESGIQNLFPGASLQKLEHLYIHFTGEQSVAVKDDARAHCIAKTLEEHSPLENLSEIEIIFRGGILSTWNDWQHYNISTPKLKCLKLFFAESPCIDMILLFSASLEDLDIETCTIKTLADWSHENGAADLRNNERIRFISCEGVLDKNSNIWTMMSKLVSAKVTCPELDDTGFWRRTKTWRRPAN